MKRLRLTVVHEFDWTGKDVTVEDIDRLVNNFLKDPTSFLALDSLGFDEKVMVDVEDISNADS